MKQTAVEWLYQELDNILPEMYPSEWDKFKIAVNKAKEIEKEQIMDAYMEGGDWESLPQPRFDNYYNATFNTANKFAYERHAHRLNE